MDLFRSHIRSLRNLQESYCQNNNGGPKLKIVAIIDSIISNPAALMPWKELTQLCREEGVWSVIDAAHSIGQELDINLDAVKPDFWVSVCVCLATIYSTLNTAICVSRRPSLIVVLTFLLELSQMAFC